MAPIQPHNGWLPSAGEAARQIEDYWDLMRRRLEERARLYTP